MATVGAAKRHPTSPHAGPTARFLCDHGPSGSRRLSQPPMWSLPEAEDLAADVRRLFDDLDRTSQGAPAGTSLHAPALDVIETPSAIEVVVDLPGVAQGDIRVVFKRSALIVAGEKRPPVDACGDAAEFHLVERNFGRFARVVRFDHAINAARARASLSVGHPPRHRPPHGRTPWPRNRHPDRHPDDLIAHATAVRR